MPPAYRNPSLPKIEQLIESRRKEKAERGTLSEAEARRYYDAGFKDGYEFTGGAKMRGSADHRDDQTEDLEFLQHELKKSGLDLTVEEIARLRIGPSSARPAWRSAQAAKS